MARILSPRLLMLTTCLLVAACTSHAGSAAPPGSTRLGNSGNTSEPHLHFQLSRGIAPLSGDNVPFEIDILTFVGQLTVDGIVNPPPAGPRTNELPLADSVTNYPPA